MQKRRKGPFEFFQEIFDPRRSLPRGSLLLFGLWGEKKPTWAYLSSLWTLGREEAHLVARFFLFSFFLYVFFFVFFGRREGGEGEGRSLPRGTFLLFRLLGEKKPTWWHPSFLIAGVVLSSCRDIGDLWCRIARRKCWRTPPRLTGEWSGIACSENDVLTRWRCRRCCSNIPTQGCG